MTTNKLGLFERSRLSKYMIQGQFSQILLKLGIEGKSIPARQLQAMAIVEGIRPEENEFSRGIIEMRDK
jgi:hypothetical protein